MRVSKWSQNVHCGINDSFKTRKWCTQVSWDVQSSDWCIFNTALGLWCVDHSPRGAERIDPRAHGRHAGFWSHRSPVSQPRSQTVSTDSSRAAPHWTASLSGPPWGQRSEIYLVARCNGFVVSVLFFLCCDLERIEKKKSLEILKIATSSEWYKTRWLMAVGMWSQKKKKKKNTLSLRMSKYVSLKKNTNLCLKTTRECIRHLYTVDLYGNLVAEP